MEAAGSSQFKTVCVSESATILLMIRIVAPRLVLLIIFLTIIYKSHPPLFIPKLQSFM